MTDLADRIAKFREEYLSGTPWARRACDLLTECQDELEITAKNRNEYWRLCEKYEKDIETLQAKLATLGKELDATVEELAEAQAALFDSHQHVHRLNEQVQELTCKGESLCYQNGNLLVQHHELTSELQVWQERFENLSENLKSTQAELQEERRQLAETVKDRNER
jgi:chromosome segregation ATPase